MVCPFLAGGRSDERNMAASMLSGSLVRVATVVVKTVPPTLREISSAESISTRYADGSDSSPHLSLCVWTQRT